MPKKRLKILLGCYACDPNFGSEPGMGWNFVSNIAKYHDVHAIVEEGEFKENLTQYAINHPEITRNIKFHFIQRAHHETLRKIWPPSYYWFYRKWQKRAFKYAVELDKAENFDLVHQVNMAGFREPGYLWKLDKPYVWGPIGGFSQTPWCLLKGTGIHSMLYFGMRNILNSFQKRFGYACRKAAQKAYTILVSDKQGMDDVSLYWKRKAEYMLEVGTSQTKRHNDVQKRERHEKFQICWAGNLIPLKALELLLFAIVKCNNSNITLEVLGDGPCETKWKKLTRKLGLECTVHFRGRIKHDEVLRIMQSSHLFCHTSIKEGGTGTVILEALQNALPAIILDHGGAAQVINETCGFRVPIHERHQVIRCLAKAINLLENNEELRHSLAIGALKRSKEFSWDAKMQQLNRIYEEATSPIAH